jgi:hypothetical protein
MVNIIDCPRCGHCCPDVSLIDEGKKAEPQEPVAWMTKAGNVWKTKADKGDIPLYTAPQPHPEVELTDEEIEQCMKQAHTKVQGRNLEHAFARAVIAAYRAKQGETK